MASRLPPCLRIEIIRKKRSGLIRWPELASEHRIPVFAPADINHSLWVEKIRELSPDILFSFYYRNLIQRQILDIPNAGCLNLHGSFLPKYRGRAPINWVLVNGEKETGVTLHYMTPRPDDGDILAQERIGISDDDTALTLHRKVARAAVKLLDEVLPHIQNGTAPRILRIMGRPLTSGAVNRQKVQSTGSKQPGR